MASSCCQLTKHPVSPEWSQLQLSHSSHSGGSCLLQSRWSWRACIPVDNFVFSKMVLFIQNNRNSLAVNQGSVRKSEGRSKATCLPAVPVCGSRFTTLNVGFGILHGCILVGTTWVTAGRVFPPASFNPAWRAELRDRDVAESHSPLLQRGPKV